MDTDQVIQLPIAVGYKVTYSEELLAKLREIVPEEDHDSIPTEVYIATKFADGHRGFRSDNTVPTEILEGWYKKKMAAKEEYKTYLSEILISPKKNIIVTTANCNGERAFGILYNKNSSGTTNLKKMIASGNHNLTEIKFDRLTLECEPYILRVPHRVMKGWGGKKFYVPV